KYVACVTSYLVRNVFAISIHTKHGIVFHYFSRVSFLHVPQKVSLSGLKRFYKPQEVPFKPSEPWWQSKPDMVNENPLQAPSTIKTVPPQNQERELSDGSITMAAAPSPRHLPIPMFCVREKIKESLKLTA
ncbi:hypothetical protein EUTSA_v10000456mg, partial [Eutrema salsugineum]